MLYNHVPRVMHTKRGRPPQIEAIARPVTETSQVIMCIAIACSNEDLQGISHYVHAFNYLFIQDGSYTLYFDSVLTPRIIKITDLQATGNAARCNMLYPVKHAFSETMDRCFIDKSN